MLEHRPFNLSCKIGSRSMKVLITTSKTQDNSSSCELNFKNWLHLTKDSENYQWPPHDHERL